MKGKSGLMDDLMREIVKDSGLKWDVSGDVKLKSRQEAYVHKTVDPTEEPNRLS
jgi:hypothetical protein